MNVSLLELGSRERYKLTCAPIRHSNRILSVGIAASINDFSNHWCKRENVEPDALKEWKINTFKIIDTRSSFYSRNTHLLPPLVIHIFYPLNLNLIFVILNKVSRIFYMNYVLVLAEKSADNVVVV